MSDKLAIDFQQQIDDGVDIVEAATQIKQELSTMQRTDMFYCITNGDDKGILHP